MPITQPSESSIVPNTMELLNYITLASHFSEYEYQKPFYYERFHNMVLAFMFHPGEGIRFSQSPTGGGDVNPAWDFQFIVPDFEVGKKYSFQARVMYKEFKGPDEVLAEYELWDSANKQH